MALSQRPGDYDHIVSGDRRSVWSAGVFIFLTTLIVLLYACDGTATENQSVILLNAEDLAGEWTLETQTECARKYPDSISFDSPGLYSARMSVSRATLWHGGDFEINEDKIRMQLANDAMREYTVVSFDGKRITLKDEEQCVFVYATQ